MIGVHIEALIDQDETFEEYFIFSNQQRKDDKVNDPAYLDTYIDTKEEYYSKPGEILTVHCHVMDINHNRVPVGQVECLIGGYHVNIEDNPQHIADSWDEESGSNTFTFRIPLFIEYGDHDLVFRYKGIYGYNSCSTTTTLHVVDRIPTNIHFIYPRPEYEYYYANNEDHFTDAITYIRDANGVDVEHGEVDYYLDTGSVRDFYLLDFPLIYERGVLIEEPYYVFINDNLIRYSAKYMFNIRRMFHANDIIECVSQEGDHIDTLIVAYCYHAYYLVSTEYIFGEEKEPNTHVKLEVIE